VTTPATLVIPSSAGLGNGNAGVVLQESGSGGVAGGSCVSTPTSGALPTGVMSVEGTCNSIPSGSTTGYTSIMTYYSNNACSILDAVGQYSSTLSTTNCQTVGATSLTGVGSIKITCSNGAFTASSVSAILLVALCLFARRAADKVL